MRIKISQMTDKQKKIKLKKNVKEREINKGYDEIV